jgi:hypothetical protein
MRSKHPKLAAIAAFLALFPILPVMADEGASDTLNWSITPYLWAPNITLDVALADTNLGGDVSFADILDTIDAGLMLHTEGGKGQWSAFADLTYVEASDVNERTLLRIDSSNEQLFLDAALAWHPHGIDAPFNIFGGLRYASLDTRYNFFSVPNDNLLTSQQSKADYYDALLGLRYRFELSERWSLDTRGDASFGDSEGTLLARASLAYTVGAKRQNRILFGYQYKQMEFLENDVTTEIRLQGPVAGFNFRF